jgi:acyl-CoA thioesterase I
MRRLLALATALLLASAPALTSSNTETNARQTPRLCADLAAGQFTVEVLGDSIAAGYGVAEPKRWANQFARQLPGPNSAVWQGAVSGSLVGDYLPGGPYYFHVQFAKAVKPTLLLVNWRVNDQWMSVEHAADGHTPAAFKARYRAVLDEIRAASPTTTIMIAVSPWILDTRIDAATYNQWDYINVLWELKVEYDAIWLDWMRFMPHFGESDTAGLLLYDRGHPSESGQSVLAAHPYERIASYCLGLEGSTP